MQSVSEENFARLKKKILEKRPVLKKILEKYGNYSLYQYAEDYINEKVNPVIKQRQEEFIKTLEKEISRLLGEDIAKSVAKQLKKYYHVSTADHHGFICHPFFLNSNLIASAPYFKSTDSILKNIVVLACSNISFDNSSFPRGLLFNYQFQNKPIIGQLPFFSRKARPFPVFRFYPYDIDSINKIKNLIRNFRDNGILSKNSATKLTFVIDNIYSRPEVLACNSFSDQITKTNNLFWKEFFNSAGTINIPNLIYIDQENFIISLLVNYHMEQKTLIHNLLFDPSFDKLIKKYFDGVNGAFSLKHKSGTYLFWAIPSTGKYRLQLWREGNILSSTDRSYKVNLTPNAISDALRSGKLIPSTLLSFIIMAFYYGVKLLGGFSQINYLTFMKEKFIKMLVEKGCEEEVEFFQNVETEQLCGDFTLAFLNISNETITNATGLDLILYGTEQTWPILENQTKNISLEESLNPMMPDFYKIVYPQSERDPELSLITSEDVIYQTKLDQKIKPCVSLSS